MSKRKYSGVCIGGPKDRMMLVSEYPEMVFVLPPGMPKVSADGIPEWRGERSVASHTTFTYVNAPLHHGLKINGWIRKGSTVEDAIRTVFEAYGS